MDYIKIKIGDYLKNTRFSLTGEKVLCRFCNKVGINYEFKLGWVRCEDCHKRNQFEKHTERDLELLKTDFCVYYVVGTKNVVPEEFINFYKDFKFIDVRCNFCFGFKNDCIYISGWTKCKDCYERHSKEQYTEEDKEIIKNKQDFGIYYKI